MNFTIGGCLKVQKEQKKIFGGATFKRLEYLLYNILRFGSNTLKEEEEGGKNSKTETGAANHYSHRIYPW